MRYFRCYAESLDGVVGEFYYEVSPAHLVTRQIYVFGDRIYWADPQREFDERYAFTDQPESDEPSAGGEEIDQAQFDALWQAGQRQ